jgi:hypothetical protein
MYRTGYIIWETAFSAEVSNEGGVHILTLYAFMAWTGITLHTGNIIKSVSVILDVANYCVGVFIS